MKNQINFLLSTVIFLSVVGCASSYKQPAQARSTVSFKLHEKFEDGSNQRFYIYPDANCTEGDGFGIAANMAKMLFIGFGAKTVNVEPGEPLFIYAEQADHSKIGSTTYTNSCGGFIEFTPEDGVHYDIEQSDSCEGILVTITNDNETIVNTKKHRWNQECG